MCIPGAFKTYSCFDFTFGAALRIFKAKKVLSRWGRSIVKGRTFKIWPPQIYSNYHATGKIVCKYYLSFRKTINKITTGNAMKVIFNVMAKNGLIAFINLC